jgi:creatinine amidohydrolase/Fe(II)-dependent formamide hydrolase-like protein
MSSQSTESCRTPYFEDTSTGRMKKQIWGASEAEIDAILAEYGIPSPCEWAKPGSYIQTTVRHEVEANRRKNDIVIIPVGSTELHGQHTVSAMDTLFVSVIAEGVRRYTATRPGGAPVSLALPPLMYGCHPYHHLGMPGTVIVREEVVKEFLIDVMLGLWNDGFRKQIILNNHGQLWVLEAALQQFCKRYQLPGLYRVMDWHRCVREFLMPRCEGGEFETPFVHADEHETSLGLLLFPEMVHMDHAVDTEAVAFLPPGHFGNAVESCARPSRWSEVEGHIAIEIAGTPEGVVGRPTAADPRKAKRAMAAILRYVTLFCDEVLEAFPPGKVPPTDMVSLRDPKQMEAYLRDPLSPGWKSVYGLSPVFE